MNNDEVSNLVGATKKRGFVKLFSIEENVEKAIFLINAGKTYKVIGQILGCDKSSVIAFHQRKINEGFKFKDFRGKKAKLRKKLVEEGGFNDENEEKINPGRDYSDYLAEYIAKRNVLQAKLMKKARKTIEKVEKMRVEYGIDKAEDMFYY